SAWYEMKVLTASSEPLPNPSTDVVGQLSLPLISHVASEWPRRSLPSSASGGASGHGSQGREPAISLHRSRRRYTTSLVDSFRGSLLGNRARAVQKRWRLNRHPPSSGLLTGF